MVTKVTYRFLSNGPEFLSHYVGLSTDSKPSGDIATNTMFEEMDTGEVWYFENGGWMKRGETPSRIEVKSYGIPYELVGDVLTIQDSDIPSYTQDIPGVLRCGYLDGDHYQPLIFTDNGGSHSINFAEEVPDEVDEVVLILRGDITLDGRLTQADPDYIDAYITEEIPSITALEVFAGDVNGDGKVKFSDENKIELVLSNTPGSVWGWDILS